jgi:hypothetical protein
VRSPWRADRFHVLKRGAQSFVRAPSEVRVAVERVIDRNVSQPKSRTLLKVAAVIALGLCSFLLGLGAVLFFDLGMS